MKTIMRVINRATSVLIVIALLASLGACGTSDIKERQDDPDVLLNQDKAGSKASQSSESEDIVFNVSAMVEYMWCLPEDLYRESELVIIATHSKDIRTFADPYTGLPNTVSTMSVSEVVKGEYKPNMIDVVYLGGRIPLEEYLAIKPHDRDMINLSDEEIKRAYIESFIMCDGTASFKDSEQKYILFLGYCSEFNAYQILANDYGALRVNSDGKIYSIVSQNYEVFSFYGRQP